MLKAPRVGAATPGEAATPEEGVTSEAGTPWAVVASRAADTSAVASSPVPRAGPLSGVVSPRPRLGTLPGLVSPRPRLGTLPGLTLPGLASPAPPRRAR